MYILPFLFNLTRFQIKSWKHAVTEMTVQNKFVRQGNIKLFSQSLFLLFDTEDTLTLKNNQHRHISGSPNSLHSD